MFVYLDELKLEQGFPTWGTHPPRAGTSNTRPAGRMRPARGFNAAPKHLLRTRKYRSLEKNDFSFNFSYEIIMFSGFYLIFHQFLFRIKKKRSKLNYFVALGSILLYNAALGLLN